jgi:hypothetical protein
MSRSTTSGKTPRPLEIIPAEGRGGGHDENSNTATQRFRSSVRPLRGDEECLSNERLPSGCIGLAAWTYAWRTVAHARSGFAVNTSRRPRAPGEVANAAIIIVRSASPGQRGHADGSSEGHCHEQAEMTSVTRSTGSSTRALLLSSALHALILATAAAGVMPS